MRANSLSDKGLSISQAQSFSNILNQKSVFLSNILNSFNNYSSSVIIEGKEHILIAGKPIRSDVIDILKKKAKYHAVQAFLMENLKAKERIIEEAKGAFFLARDPFPEAPETETEVKEEWGWEQLTANELNEYYEAEAFAAHLGQFIHKGGRLDLLRKEVPTIPAIQWMEVKKDEKTPISITIHHEEEKLLSLHEEISRIHSKYEQKVNYFKAKVKNLVTLKNAEIAKKNMDIRAAYDKKVQDYTTALETERQEHNLKIQNKIKEVAAKRIQIADMFQDVINELKGELGEKSED